MSALADRLVEKYLALDLYDPDIAQAIQWLRGLADQVVRLRKVESSAKRVVDDFKVMVDGAGNESASVSAEAMVGLEAALARAT